MIKKYIIYWLSGLFLYNHSCYSQNDNNLGLGINGYYGFILPHHTTVAYLVKEKVKAAEINIIQQRSGKNTWEQIYKLPQTGLSFLVMDLGNPQELGNLIGISPFINFPLKKNTNLTTWFKINVGLCYVSKKFDPLLNHKNIVIATNVNALISLRLNTQLKLSEKFLLETGLSITHFSNGAFKMPNLGINIPSVHLGLLFFPNPISQTTSTELPAFIKTWEYNLYSGTALTEIEPIGGKKFNVYTLSANAVKNLNRKSKIGIGLDIFYNKANILKLEEDSIYLKNKFLNFQNGIKACYELNIGKLSIPFEMGFYTFTKVKRNGFLYNQFGLKYMFNSHFFTQIILKTHFAKADFTEIGLGYKIFK